MVMMTIVLIFWQEITVVPPMLINGHVGITMGMNCMGFHGGTD